MSRPIETGANSDAALHKVDLLTSNDLILIHQSVSNLNYLCCSFTDTYIQKTKKSYIDSRARRNLGSINTELQDIQRIMVANIEEVLQRGEALSGKSMLS